MGASSATPVEKPRDKSTNKNGHTSSIMDYAVLIMLPNQKTALPVYSSELETMTYGQSNGDTLLF
jgi:hypothetical protein